MAFDQAGRFVFNAGRPIRGLVVTETIDLRSDTITKPTPAMRQAMAAAEVGDDVFKDDPTVNALEARTAELLGTEDAVYLPSGTMTNQVAIRCHTEPGDEIFCDADSHIHWYEGGGPAAISGATCNLLAGERGIFSADQLAAAIRPANQHYPRPKLVCIENTHNRGGGTVWPIDKITEVAEVAEKAGLKMHMDGARLWNAAVASGISEREYAKHFDSVSVCFSKGLGAPIGSALAGCSEFIARARHIRKMLGGGMRQAGIIAAGALYALDNNRDRLADDHQNAKALAEGLSRIDGIEIDPASVETNIVIFGLAKMSSHELVERLAGQGVLVLPRDDKTIRAVTNLMVTGKAIEQAVEIIRQGIC